MSYSDETKSELIIIQMYADSLTAWNFEIHRLHNDHFSSWKTTAKSQTNNHFEHNQKHTC